MHGVAFALQRQAHKAADVGFVFDDEDVGGQVGHGDCRAARSNFAGGVCVGAQVGGRCAAWQQQRKACACRLALGVVDGIAPDAAAMRLHDGAANRQPQAHTGCGTFAGAALELFKQQLFAALEPVQNLFPMRY